MVSLSAVGENQLFFLFCVSIDLELCLKNSTPRNLYNPPSHSTACSFKSKPSKKFGIDFSPIHLKSLFFLGGFFLKFDVTSAIREEIFVLSASAVCLSLSAFQSGHVRMLYTQDICSCCKLHGKLNTMKLPRVTYEVHIDVWKTDCKY